MPRSLSESLAVGLTCSMLLGGSPVLITDWLPGLDWRITVAPAFIDILPTLGGKDGIWQLVEPRLSRWLARPASEGGVFALPPQWDGCLLTLAHCRLPGETASYVIHCRWGAAWPSYVPRPDQPGVLRRIMRC